MHRRHSLLIGLRIALSVCLPAAAFADWRAPYEALDQQHSWGAYSVLYTREGVDAFPAKRAQAPRRDDYLRRLQGQIDNADRVYSNELDLTPPLRMPLYARGRRIHLHLLHQDKGMGAAGDRLVRYRYRQFGRSPRVLSVTLATRWTPPNVTPEHELFHLYQYGYSFFKNGWYLEGLARSAERFFTDKASAFRWEKLPATGAALDDVMRRGYTANTLWNRLAMLCDADCTAPQDRADASSATGGDGDVERACGATIVRPLLEALGVQDDIAATDRGIDPDNWPETEQRSLDNNPYILAAVETVLETSCPLETSAELRRFHAVVTAKAKR